MYVLFSPLMPKGVEHPDRGDQRNLGTYLFSPLMPKGVEHKVFEFFKEYADDEAVFPSDAERR